MKLVKIRTLLPHRKMFTSRLILGISSGESEPHHHHHWLIPSAIFGSAQPLSLLSTFASSEPSPLHFLHLHQKAITIISFFLTSTPLYSLSPQLTTEASIPPIVTEPSSPKPSSSNPTASPHLNLDDIPLCQLHQNISSIPRKYVAIKRGICKVILH